MFMKTLENGSPQNCILLSSVIMTLCILTIDIKGIAKLASSFNLIIFISGDVSLMIYRANSHGKYAPEYVAPFYPVLPILGIVGQLALLVVMGSEGIWACLVFGVLGSIIYLAYGQHHANFLGVLVPETYLMILPKKFHSSVALKKELMRIRKDPLYHYHHMNEDVQAKSRASSVNQLHTKRFSFCEKKSQLGNAGLVEMETLRNYGHNMYVFRVAFTGGYKGGKHTLINLLSKRVVADHLYDVYICPKISNFFFNHGVHYDPDMGHKEKVFFQAEMLRTQLRHERAFLRLAGLSDRPSIIFYNRGLMDLKSHCDEQTWEEVLDVCDVDEEYLCDRYDLVLHCESVCASKENRHKRSAENPGASGGADTEKYLRIDTALKDAWAPHSDQVILHWSDEFEHKLKQATDALQAMIAEQAEQQKRASILLNAEMAKQLAEFGDNSDDKESSEEKVDAAFSFVTE
jgi:hypothetical protein